MSNEIQVLITFSGIIMSGVSAYTGVKIAITELRSAVNQNKRDIEDLDKRIDRIEQKLFFKD